MVLNKNKRNVPYGMRDIIFSETQSVSDMGLALCNLYEKSGYGKVMTPSVEYFDLFDFENRVIPEEYMYKMTDRSGKLIVLRPDNTMPIARVASTRLKDAPLPIKLCYNQNIFLCRNSNSGKRSEIFQTGVEIIGGDTFRTDIESVTLALRSLKKILNYLGNRVSIKLEIGHVGYFKALISSFGLSKEDENTVCQYVESKNSSAINEFESYGENMRGAISVIKQITRLFGNEEVFSKAKSLAGQNEGALEAIEYLKKIYDILAPEYKDIISVDLSTAHEIEYYTGFVFRAYLEYAGEPVISGGRYDKLLSNFDFTNVATGFGVNLSLISDVAHTVFEEKEQKSADILIHYDPAYLGIVEKYMEESKGICEMSSYEKLTDTIKYAKEKRIEKVIEITQRTCGVPTPVSEE